MQLELNTTMPIFMCFGLFNASFSIVVFLVFQGYNFVIPPQLDALSEHHTLSSFPLTTSWVSWDEGYLWFYCFCTLDGPF